MSGSYCGAKLHNSDVQFENFLNLSIFYIHALFRVRKNISGLYHPGFFEIFICQNFCSIYVTFCKLLPQAKTLFEMAKFFIFQFPTTHGIGLHADIFLFDILYAI